MDETQGSWNRALVVVLADGAIIKQRVWSACCHIAPGHSSILLWDNVPVHFRIPVRRQSPAFVQHGTAQYTTAERKTRGPLARALDPNRLA